VLKLTQKPGPDWPGFGAYVIYPHDSADEPPGKLSGRAGIPGIIVRSESVFQSVDQFGRILSWEIRCVGRAPTPQVVLSHACGDVIAQSPGRAHWQHEDNVIATSEVVNHLSDER
jgi:hypothetical protein